MLDLINKLLENHLETVVLITKVEKQSYRSLGIYMYI